MDVFGKALQAYNNGDKDATITVESNIAETDEWSLAEFFHSWEDMGDIERHALTMTTGRTLDVGAGSGSHTLWLQEKGIAAEALDISEGAAEVMKKRGVKTVHLSDFALYETDKPYDTILMLMNGAGLAGNVDGLDALLQQAKSLLAPGGQILLDSSDLIYLYEEEDGSFAIPLDGYYGELQYTYIFKGEKSEPFGWVFVDQQTLQNAAERNGLDFEIVCEGDHYDYLARLTAKE